MMRYVTAIRLICCMLVAAASPGAAVAESMSPAALAERMQGGGLVVFLRHAATDAGEVDTGRLGDRAGQRNLSDAGRAQARALGEAYAALSIPVSRVLASPVFRARDTAEIMFGAERVEVTMDVVADDYAGPALRPMLEATRALLERPHGAGGNLVIVGHRTPLEMATGRPFPDTVLPEGAAAVFAPGERPHFLGTISADALIDLAEVR